MTIHIVTDSSHHLDPAIIEALKLHVLPLSLHLAGEDRRERLEITTEGLFAALKDRNAGWPTTAAVSPAALQEAYDELTADGDEVVGVFMSRGTSVTVENAQCAAAEHPNRERIHVVDSLVVSGALALTLRVLAQRRDEGMQAADLAHVARTMGERMRVMFTVDTLDYLHRGGRMKGSQALVGTLLGIKPVLWLNEGRIELWSRSRGKRKALDAMLDETVKAMPGGEPVRAVIFDTAEPGEVDALGKALAVRLKVERLDRDQIGPVVAAHVGPGCIALGGLPGKRHVLMSHELAPAWEPSYLGLHRSGELRRRARAAMASLAACELCPHACKANRLEGKHGVCRVEGDAVIASWNVHPWEEPPISGTRGSGTIFFSGCTGRCRFCQNYSISQMNYGNRVTIDRFAGMMLELQRRGVHNINFVTPTHFIAHILAALDVAAGWGLHIPLVYNTSGYERVETLRLLDGVIDVYLPDIKYADDAVAKRLSGFPNYVHYDRLAVQEMLRQVGPQLVCDEEGIARRGMIVRHLVLPEGLANTPSVMDWISQELSPEVHVSVMDQYFPTYRTIDDPVLGRKITEAEYEAALDAFDAAGLQNGWLQDHEGE